MLSRSATEQIIARALSGGGDYAELYVEDTIRNTIGLSGGSIDAALSGEDYGASVRVLRGTECVYCYTNDVSLASLLELASRAAAAIGSVAADRNVTLVERYALQRSAIRIVPSSVPNGRKAEIVRRAYEAARGHSRDIVQAVVTHRDVDQRFSVATSDGSFVQDRRVYTRLAVKAVASDGTANQTGYIRPDAQLGLELYETETPEKVALAAAQTAVTMLHASPSPVGEMPVVIASGNGGVFFHEACGHSLESACVSRDASIYCGKLGCRIASEKVSAVDDGTIPNGWGSINVDDEGVPSTRTVLIDKGILVGYMVDRLGARRMGCSPTGCGRKESYRFCPTSRMTNTYVCAGDDEDEDIIGSVERGLYAEVLGGGTANTQTSSFNFHVQQAYSIEGGRITRAVRGATITGLATDALMNIEMVGSKVEFGAGMCGSSSGSLPVSNGQPMIKISRLTVGGK